MIFLHKTKMSSEIINVLSNNKIEKFDLLDNLEDYIKLKQ